MVPILPMGFENVVHDFRSIDYYHQNAMKLDDRLEFEDLHANRHTKKKHLN